MAGLSVGVLMKDSQVLIPKVTVFSETISSSPNLALFRKVTPGHFSGKNPDKVFLKKLLFRVLLESFSILLSIFYYTNPFFWLRLILVFSQSSFLYFLRQRVSEKQVKISNSFPPLTLYVYFSASMLKFENSQVPSVFVFALSMHY